MGNRRKGRILAFQALFAWDAAKDREAAKESLLDFSWEEEPEHGNPDFSRLLFAGTVENIESIDSTVRRHLDNWDFSRLNRVDRALLRLGVYEMLYNNTPPSILIDEAVGIAKEYGTDDSYRFINGVLDGIRKSMQEEAE